MSTVPRERWCPEPRDIDPTEPFSYPERSELHWLDASDYKHWRSRALRIWSTLQMPMMQRRREDGSFLYSPTSSGGWKRTRPLSSSRRKKVIERDHVCVWCGDGPPFEVDHIIRYVDGGSNEMDNLRTLCLPCHRSRGGHG